MTINCVLILVHLNECVVCDSVLQMGHSSDGCLSTSILCKYECRMGYLFFLIWDRVRRVFGVAYVE